MLWTWHTDIWSSELQTNDLLHWLGFRVNFGSRRCKKETWLWIKLTQLTQLLVVASASVGIWIIIPVRGVLKLIKGRSLPDQASIWLAAWPQWSTREMPELTLDGKAEKKQCQTKAPSKPRLLNYKAEWTIMLRQDDRELNGWSSNGVDHQMVSIIQ